MIRNRLRTAIGAAAAVIILEAAFASPAHAYLDPGTGSYVIQMLIAGLLGAAFALKTFWWQVKSFVLGLFGKKPAAPAPQAAAKAAEGEEHPGAK